MTWFAKGMLCEDDPLSRGRDLGRVGADSLGQKCHSEGKGRFIMNNGV